MDHYSVAQIRQTRFSPALRGYDKHEVDNFLAELADWLETGGEDESRSDVVQGELERIGEETGAILTAAHAAAEAMREDAERDTRKRLIEANLRVESIQSDVDGELTTARQEADAYMHKTKTSADAYDKDTREQSDAYADQTRADAEMEAKAIVERANAEASKIVEAAARKRKDIESMISDLEQRRSSVLSELESLASGITGATTQHRVPKQQETADVSPEAETPEPQRQG